MATKDITDKQVVEAYLYCRYFNESNPPEYWIQPYRLLHDKTGQPYKVCQSAISRAVDRGYIDYGVSIDYGWVTGAGRELLK
jgi:hypothetical protein